MRFKAIICLAVVAAPLSAAAQFHGSGIHQPNLSPGRAGSGGKKKQVQQKDPYTYGASPLAPAESNSTGGLINPFFSRPAPVPVEGAPAGLLVLPVLTGQVTEKVMECRSLSIKTSPKTWASNSVD